MNKQEILSSASINHTHQSECWLLTGYISETIKLGALGIPPYRTFVLDELKEGTNNFDASNLIGEETHGQVHCYINVQPNLLYVKLDGGHHLTWLYNQVYKGWLTDGTLVAIRSLKMKKRHSIQSYTHQLELISKLRHSHLVSAIGHCFECHKDDSTVSRIFLVFEYVPNGTLRKYISGKHKFLYT